MPPLTGRVALITGASRGLGHALARQLAADGVRVAVCARSVPLGLGADIHTSVVDVTDGPAVAAWVAAVTEALGPPDFLINNAGIGTYQPFETTTLAALAAVVDVNLKGVLHTCHAVLPGMLARRRGHIINIASDLARRPLAGMAVYAATKHAVLGFSASLLREVKDRGVRVTCVHPGVMDTYFGGSHPGRDVAGALRPEAVAALIAQVLAQPPELVLDELTIHPPGQDF